MIADRRLEGAVHGHAILPDEIAETRDQIIFLSANKSERIRLGLLGRPCWPGIRECPNARD